MRSRIGLRLTVWYTTLLGVLLLALGGLVYFSVSRRLVGEVDRRLEAWAEWAAQTVAEEGDLEELEEHQPTSLRVQVWDRPGAGARASAPEEGGRSFSPPSVRARAWAGETVWETVRTGEGPPLRWVTQPLRAAGQVRYLVQVGASLQTAQAAQRALLLGLGAVIPLALLAAAGGGYLLARRALRPVDALTRAARHITAEELHHRLPDYPVDDELGRLTQTLNEMIARLEDSFEQVHRFTADASHELRTPLTVLRGELEVALRSVRSPEEYERILASNLEEVQQMERLVDNLLTLARADAGEAQLEFATVEVTDLLREVVAQGQVLARDKGLTLTLEQHAAGMTVCGDASRLRELLLNLIDNAVKYTPAGGAVRVRCRGEDQRVKITVTDTGAGIPPKHLPHLFDRFYRVDKARSRELGGSGLGLAIGRWIAEAHEGRLEVQSEVGQGTTFTVTLPQH